VVVSAAALLVVLVVLVVLLLVAVVWLHLLSASGLDHWCTRVPPNAEHSSPTGTDGAALSGLSRR
jgi:hypothetical protein